VKAWAGVVGFAALAAGTLVIAPVAASVPEGAPVAPGGSVCPGAVGDPGAVAVVNLTPVEATGAGFGAVRSSDAPSNNSLGDSAVSNVNFRPGSVDPNVAFAAIGGDRRVCFDNSPHASVHLVADQMGVMPGSAYQPAAATGAKRLVDTRPTGPVAPGASVCPQAVGAPGRIAVVNITPVEATGPGFGAVRSSDAPSNNTLGSSAVSNVNFSVGSVDPNLAFAMIGSDGRICFDNSPHSAVQLIIDQMGSLPASAFVPAAASGATRLIDTRIGWVVGGIGVTSVAPGAAVCARAVGQPGDIAVVNGTPVDAGGAGFMAARSSDAPSNNTLGDAAVSNWNFGPGSVDPNVAFAKIGPDRMICVDNSTHATVQMVLDQAGYIPAGQFAPASATGAARVVDTRRDFVAAPAPVPTTTVPPGATVPSAPLSVTALRGPGTITVAWSPPATDGGAPVDSYSIERSVGDTDHWQNLATTTQNTHVDRHLSPNTLYAYRVTAHNAVGFGPPSAWAFEFPDPPQPPTSVTGLVAVPGANSATLTWSAPASDGGAPVTYDVWYDDVPYDSCGPANWESALKDSTTGTTFSTSTLANAWYCFRVTARNSAGSALPVETLVRPGRAAAPAPCTLTAEFWPDQGGGGDWELTVTWSTPAYDGGYPITGYNVEWFRDGMVDHTDVMVPSTSRSAYFSQVPPGHSYTARVYAWNQSTSGERCFTNSVFL
jgi:hypothetical protein